jgi:hypothetical protein
MGLLRLLDGVTTLTQEIPQKSPKVGQKWGKKWGKNGVKSGAKFFLHDSEELATWVF